MKEERIFVIADGIYTINEESAKKLGDYTTYVKEEWHSPEEKPKDSGDLTLTVERNGKRCSIPGWYSEEKGAWIDCNERERIPDEEVIAWTELPKPYEVSNNK